MNLLILTIESDSGIQKSKHKKSIKREKGTSKLCKSIFLPTLSLDSSCVTGNVNVNVNVNTNMNYNKKKDKGESTILKALSER